MNQLTTIIAIGYIDNTGERDGGIKTHYKNTQNKQRHVDAPPSELHMPYSFQADKSARSIR